MHQPPGNFDDTAIRLKTRLQELSGRLAAVRADQRRAAEALSLDSSDRATQRENDDVVDAIGVSVATECQGIKEALRRIEAGTYGLCVSCGSPIGEARLGAVPYATRCNGCESVLQAPSR